MIKPTHPSKNYLLSAVLATSLLSGLSLNYLGFVFNPERIALFAAAPIAAVLVLASARKTDLAVLAVILLFFTVSFGHNGEGWLPRFLIYGGPMLFAILASRIDSALILSIAKGKAPLLFSISMSLLFLAGPDRLPLLFEGNRFRFLLFEPNIYGAFCAYIFVAYLSNISLKLEKIVTAALLFLSVAYSMSKGPIIAAGLGALLFFVLDGKLRTLRGLLTIGTVLALAFFVSTLFITSTFYEENLARSSTTSIRVLVFSEGIAQFLQSPLVGNGPISFGKGNHHLLAYMGSDNQKNLWLGQLQVSYLHDFGVIGWLAIHALILYLVTKNYRRFSLEAFPGCTAAFFTIYAAAQFTSTHTTGLFWVALGLCCCRPNPKFIERI